MITRLELVNFRRHRHSVIDIDASARLILIEGGNGAGKSTVVEAILWALYGEGRDGRSNLDALVRRGGEDEGMQVSLTFTRGDRTYVVTRSRRRGHSAATLTLDGADLAVLPSSVTTEIVTLLGVDAAGFRLAAYAQQKELDALASLQPARRGQMLGRLLGVDEVSAARGDAVAEARVARSALAALGAGDDLEALAERVADSAREQGRYQQLVEQLEQELARYQTRSAELAEGEAQWQEENRRRLARSGALDQLQARQRQLVEQRQTSQAALDELEDMGTDGVTGPNGAAAPQSTVDELHRAMSSLRARLESARRDRELVEHRKQLTVEAETLHRELSNLIQRVDICRDAAAKVPQLAARRVELDGRLQEQNQQVEKLQGELSGQLALLSDAEHACASAQGLDDRCDACGQEVSAAARDALHHTRTALVDTLRTQVAALQEQVAQLRHARDESQRLLGDAESELRSAEQLAAQLSELGEREAATLQRRQLIDGKLERLPSSAEPVEGLEAQVSRHEQALDQAIRHRDRHQSRTQLEQQLADLAEQLQQAEQQIAQLQAQQISDELQAAHLEHLDVQAELARLQNEHGQAAQAAAVTKERLAGLQTALDSARERAETRRHLERAAHTATAAANVLEEVADRLTTQIRPALEAEVSQMLDRLSEGRYSSVKLDENYDLWVHDDGGPQPLASLSGGEIDLVALAVRLALAAVVADRNATQGPEFLILDECFGSQDAARQRSIVSALRQLEGVYQQVFVISHVPGVRDEVDRVIEVSGEVQDDVRTAQIS